MRSQLVNELVATLLDVGAVFWRAAGASVTGVASLPLLLVLPYLPVGKPCPLLTRGRAVLGALNDDAEQGFVL